MAYKRSRTTAVEAQRRDRWPWTGLARKGSLEEKRWMSSLHFTKRGPTEKFQSSPYPGKQSQALPKCKHGRVSMISLFSPANSPFGKNLRKSLILKDKWWKTFSFQEEFHWTRLKASTNTEDWPYVDRIQWARQTGWFFGQGGRGDGCPFGLPHALVRFSWLQTT